ncbi:LacI family transcriptional regulator [Paenibacillus anaericanus]|uniref:LacI family transcriptional regulator n=2 Tax=Paenibacillus TaxID=44249 RepID=A0A3S1DX46_9BACL|nr:LacI family transcriptional regulator [Paenibacillus anaericanus]
MLRNENGGIGMATIKDVAERVGVSVTLVSRTLNNQKGVKPESRAKILQAMRDLNYVPNELARSLVLQRTNTIGIVLDYLSSPSASKLIKGLEKGVDEFDKEGVYNIIYCSASGDFQKKQRHVAFLTKGRADGVLIYGSLVTDDEIIMNLSQSNFPTTLIENDLDSVNANKVVMDNVDGAYRATQYLIGLGHRRIAHVTGNINLKITLERLNGYMRALQDAQIPIDPTLIIYPDFSVPQGGDTHDVWSIETYIRCGYESGNKLMDHPDRPTAIFFATDISAFGAMKALEERGLSVPDDVSIFGYDDERPADFGFQFEPISTVKQPLELAGYTGIKQVISSLQDLNAPKERIVLKTDLIIRNSCKEKV